MEKLNLDFSKPENQKQFEESSHDLKEATIDAAQKEAEHINYQKNSSKLRELKNKFNATGALSKDDEKEAIKIMLNNSYTRDKRLIDVAEHLFEINKYELGDKFLTFQFRKIMDVVLNTLDKVNIEDFDDDDKTRRITGVLLDAPYNFLFVAKGAHKESNSKVYKQDFVVSLTKLIAFTNAYSENFRAASSLYSDLGDETRSNNLTEKYKLLIKRIDEDSDQAEISEELKYLNKTSAQKNEFFELIHSYCEDIRNEQVMKMDIDNEINKTITELTNSSN